MNEILLSKIYPDPDQPRQFFNKTELNELKQSIKQEGILTPLVLESNYKDGYLLLDGERRYRCSKDLKIQKVPAIVIEGPLSFQERTVKRFHIQEQNRSWTIFDRARAIYMFKLDTGFTIMEIAQKLGENPSQVHHMLNVMDFSENAQKRILDKKIKFTYLIHLIKIVKDYMSFSDFDKEEIETKLLDKVEAGKFNATDIQKFSKLMSTYEHQEEKIKFLQDLEYSIDQLFDNTRMNQSLEIETSYKNLMQLDIDLSNLKSKKYKLSKNYIEMLQKIKIKIEEFL